MQLLKTLHVITKILFQITKNNIIKHMKGIKFQSKNRAIDLIQLFHKTHKSYKISKQYYDN